MYDIISKKSNKESFFIRTMYIYSFLETFGQRFLGLFLSNFIVFTSLHLFIFCKQENPLLSKIRSMQQYLAKQMKKLFPFGWPHCLKEVEVAALAEQKRSELIKKLVNDSFK